jgi:hypothetical protein
MISPHRSNIGKSRKIRAFRTKADPWDGVPAISVLLKWILPYGTLEAKAFVDILTSELHGYGDEAHDDMVMALWMIECHIRQYKDFLNLRP